MIPRALSAMDTPTPGFFGLRRRLPDGALLSEELRSRLRAPEVPRPLLDRARRSAAKRLAAKRARSGAASFEQKVLERVSMGWNLAELEQIEELGVAEYVERQLHPEDIDDFGLEDAIAEALPTTRMTPAQILFQYREELQIPFFELQLATLFRSIYNPRQLFERMVVFWTDHFNIDIESDESIFLKPTDDREVIRAHALGTFPELLHASAKSPAMLAYLTNTSNVAGHPNENYARELMELHTLGVDAGYTQEDVREVARCFTGWTAWGYDAGSRFGQFVFNPAHHDFGAKTVLGVEIPAGGGLTDGEKVLDILAGHSNTASFIARKMLRYLWGYEPDERAVDRIAAIYLDTGGDVKAMLRGILTWHQLAVATPKLMRPYHLIISAVRALFGEVARPLALLEAALAAGHLPYNWPPPNGYPDSDGYWSGFVLPRWNFATTFLTGGEGGPVVRLDLDFLDPSRPPAELVTILDLLLLNGTMGPATRRAVTTFLAAGPADPRRLGEAIGLVVASPEYQNY